MRNEPYAGMGNVSKAEGLYLQNEKKKKKEMKKIEKKQTFFFSRTREGYSMIPNELGRDLNLPNSAKVAYLVGVGFADNTTRETFRGRNAIAKYVRVKPNQLSVIYGKLKKAGWITTIQRGLNKTNIIIFHAYKNEKISSKEKKKYKQKIEAQISSFYRQDV